MSEGRVCEHVHGGAGAGRLGALCEGVALVVGLAGCTSPAPGGEEGRLRGPMAVQAVEATVSPALAVDDTVHATGLYDMDPAIAFDGSRYLAAWTRLDGGASHVHAVRLSADGAPLDELDVPIGEGDAPWVAAGSGQFVVVWRDGEGIDGVRMDSDGAVLGTFAVTSPDPVSEPRVVAGTSGFLIVWDTGQKQIRYARVDSSGAVLDPGGVVLATASTYSRTAVAFDGQRYLVAWRDGTTIRAARIEEDGTVLDPSGVVVTTTCYGLGWLAATFDGTRFVIAWDDITQSLRAARVTTAGQVLDADGVVLSAEVSVPSSGLTLGSDGASTFAVWGAWVQDRQRYTYMVRLSPDGAVLDAEDRLLAGGGTTPAIAAAPGHVMVVWSQQDYEPSVAIHGSRLDAAGDPVGSPPLQVSRRKNAQRQAAAVFDGQRYVVAWTDDRNGGLDTATDIYATRVTLAGEVRDPGGLRLTMSAHEHQGARGVLDGDVTTVAWWACEVWPADGDPSCAVKVARVDAQGQVLAPGVLSVPLSKIGPPGPAPAVSVGLGSALVAMADDDGAFEIAYVSGAGAVSGPHVLGVETAGIRQVLSGFAGDDHLVVWVRASAIEAVRVDGSGASVDDPSAPRVLAASAGVVSASVAFDGSHHVVVWHESAAGVGRIRAVRVSPDGAVMDATPIELHEVSGCDSLALGPAAAAFDGEHTVVAWTTCRGGDVDVQAAAIDSSGAVAGRFDVTADAEVETAPSVASEGGGRSLVVYGQVEDAPVRGIERAMGRFVELTPGAPAPDAGPGMPDAGPDAPDAGPDAPDAGRDVPGAGGGCACRAGGGARSGLMSGLLAVFGVWVTRRRRGCA